MDKDIALIVDEDTHTLKEIEQIVSKETFETLYCANAQEALAALEKSTVSVLVCNIRLQVASGVSLLNKVKDLYPDTIRIALADSSQLELGQVLFAINHGEVFRVITKPWQDTDELSTVLRRAFSYYNLCRDKKRLELSLEQRNTAYKNMLRTLEARLTLKKENLQHAKQFLLLILAGFTKEMSCSLAGEGRVILTYVLEIVDDYFKTLPTLLDGFTLKEIIWSFQKYIRENSSKMTFSDNIGHPEIRCFGNPRLLTMLLLAIIKLLDYSHTNYTFKANMSVDNYEGRIRLNTVIELGHVGGVLVPECSDEVLLHDNLNYYISLLAHLGQPYHIFITYTYVNQNTAIITAAADISLFDPEKVHK